MGKKGNSAPAYVKSESGAKIAIEEWPIERVLPYAANARAHPPSQIAKLRASIREFGFNVPCLVDKDDVLIAGHGRVMAAKEEGHETVPVIRLEHLTPAQVRAFRLMDNRVQLDSSWLDDLLVDELSALKALDFDLSLTGFDDADIAKLLGDEDGAGGGPAPTLADKFMIPPFSVLNAREGWWQDRKRQWIGLGIQSELGRGEDLIPNGGGMTSKERYAGGAASHRARASPGQAERLHEAASRGGAQKASPGGSMMPSTSYSKDGKRGDGRGRPIG